MKDVRRDSESPVVVHASWDEIEETPNTSWWADVWQRFCHQKVPPVAVVILLLIILSAMLAPLIAPHDPLEQFRTEGLSERGVPKPPNAKFWLGTDRLGRDLFSRVLYGGRISLFVGFVASGVAIVLSLLVGGVSGFAGGQIDFALMRFTDFMMGVPTFFLILLLVILLGSSIWVIIFVIAAFSWTYGARIFRSQVLSLKNQDFVEAAVAIGASRRRIFFRHILPHVIPLMIVYLALGIPGTIFTEVGLSFIGLGVPPPIPSWGSMLQDGIAVYRIAPWVSLFPGLAIMITVISLNLVGTGLREAMDPTCRKR